MGKGYFRERAHSRHREKQSTKTRRVRKLLRQFKNKWRQRQDWVEKMVKRDSVGDLKLRVGCNGLGNSESGAWRCPFLIDSLRGRSVRRWENSKNGKRRNAEKLRRVRAYDDNTNNALYYQAGVNYFPPIQHVKRRVEVCRDRHLAEYVRERRRQQEEGKALGGKDFGEPTRIVTLPHDPYIDGKRDD